MALHYFQIRQLYLMFNAIETMKRRNRINQIREEARCSQKERLNQRKVEINLFGIRSRV